MNEMDFVAGFNLTKAFDISFSIIFTQWKCTNELDTLNGMHHHICYSKYFGTLRLLIL